MIDDPTSRRRLSVTFGRPYREVVVYNPGHREAFCIEPYTCVCDPFRLHAEGVDAGLIELDPGDSIASAFSIRLHAASSPDG